jgi:hypothetical protein
MPYNAMVSCGCWDAGLIEELPVPEEWLSYDAWDEPYVDPRYCPEDEYRKADWDFFFWKQDACVHGLREAEETFLCREVCEEFMRVLARAGRDDFPTLLDGLGTSGTGQTPFEQAERGLEELEKFRKVSDLDSQEQLINTATGKPLYDPATALAWATAAGRKYGLTLQVADEQFVITDSLSGVVRFRSPHFRQRLLTPGRKGPVELVDVETGAKYISLVPVGGRTKQETDLYFVPPEVHVEDLSVLPEDYEPILKKMERLFQASTETASPVCWGVE